MAEQTGKRRLLVGLGSFQGDDQVGWKLAEAVGSLASIPVRQAAVPADILHWLDGVEELYLYDACLGTNSIGSLHRWEYRAGSRDLKAILDDLTHNEVSLRSKSTHHISLMEVLELAKSLNILPMHVVIWAIEGRRFGAGQPMSEELSRQIPVLVNQVASDFSHA